MSAKHVATAWAGALRAGPPRAAVNDPVHRIAAQEGGSN